MHERNEGPRRALVRVSRRQGTVHAVDRQKCGPVAPRTQQKRVTPLQNLPTSKVPHRRELRFLFMYIQTNTQRLLTRRLRFGSEIPRFLSRAFRSPSLYDPLRVSTVSAHQYLHVGIEANKRKREKTIPNKPRTKNATKRHHHHHPSPPSPRAERFPVKQTSPRHGCAPPSHPQTAHMKCVKSLVTPLPSGSLQAPPPPPPFIAPAQPPCRP